MNAHWWDRLELMEVNHAKGVNTPQSPRMWIVELSDKVWSIDITFILLGILLITIPLPFNEELQLAPSHATIQHLFDLEMFFAIK